MEHLCSQHFNIGPVVMCLSAYFAKHFWSLVTVDTDVSGCVCRFWVMPSVVLKNVIMGNLHRPTNDHTIVDSIDFVSDTVNAIVIISSKKVK